MSISSPNTAKRDSKTFPRQDARRSAHPRSPDQRPAADSQPLRSSRRGKATATKQDAKNQDCDKSKSQHTSEQTITSKNNKTKHTKYSFTFKIFMPIVCQTCNLNTKKTTPIIQDDARITFNKSKSYKSYFIMFTKLFLHCTNKASEHQACPARGEPP